MKAPACSRLKMVVKRLASVLSGFQLVVGGSIAATASLMHRRVERSAGLQLFHQHSCCGGQTCPALSITPRLGTAMTL